MVFPDWWATNAPQKALLHPTLEADNSDLRWRLVFWMEFMKHREFDSKVLTNSMSIGTSRTKNHGSAILKLFSARPIVRHADVLLTKLSCQVCTRSPVGGLGVRRLGSIDAFPCPIGQKEWQSSLKGVQVGKVNLSSRIWTHKCWSSPASRWTCDDARRH